MAEAQIEIDSGTGELLCEIRDRVALIAGAGTAFCADGDVNGIGSNSTGNRNRV